MTINNETENMQLNTSYHKTQTFLVLFIKKSYQINEVNFFYLLIFPELWVIILFEKGTNWSKDANMLKRGAVINENNVRPICDWGEEAFFNLVV